MKKTSKKGQNAGRVRKVKVTSVGFPGVVVPVTTKISHRESDGLKGHTRLSAQRKGDETAFFTAAFHVNTNTTRRFGGGATKLTGETFWNSEPFKLVRDARRAVRGRARVSSYVKQGSQSVHDQFCIPI